MSVAHRMIVYDAHGRSLDLVGTGHRGGEGTVYRIAGDASRVAKIYHAGRLGAGLHTKLRVMLDHPPTDPSRNGSGHRSIAWVDGLVFDDRSGRDLRGFTMPYVDTGEFRQAHVYYDVADRLRSFGGGFTWRHLLFAARNLAAAVDAVHSAGHRVGDLRETNLLVSPTALVTLIDCDSFQIKDPRTHQIHPTRVATGDYLPPELQGIDFRNQDPDRYAGDLFALGVLVFRFLMLGVHPFQARGPAVSEVPTTEAKIRKGLFAFAGRGRGVQPPEYAPPYAIVPKSLQHLFAQAFVRGHGDPDVRPSAADWAEVLEAEAQRLRHCNTNANHWFAGRSRGCPWCRWASDPFPAGLSARRQIAIQGAPSQNGEASRVDEIRAYARVALADGALTDAEFAYLRKTGTELGLNVAVIDRVIDDESRRLPLRTNGSSGSPRSTPPSIRETFAHPIRTIRSATNRRARSAMKAAAPVLVGCVLAGALAPVVAAVVATIIVLPALAIVGEIDTRRGWRARAGLPLAFARHAHIAIGHAARVFVPLAATGLATVSLSDVRLDWVVRALGASAMAIFSWIAITRLPHAGDRSASAVKAGRDLVWRSLVGESGRTRRATYVLWAACIGAGILVATDSSYWWPLTIR